jgi:hypothetical protein
MRRRERIPEPAEQAEPWDIVAIDAPLSSCPLRGSETEHFTEREPA